MHHSYTNIVPCFLACTAYTRYVLDIGQSEDWLALQMALAPCLLGYGAVADMLLAHPDTVRDAETNIYWPWIENYGAADYVEAVRLGSGMFCLSVSLPPPRYLLWSNHLRLSGSLRFQNSKLFVFVANFFCFQVGRI